MAGIGRRLGERSAVDAGAGHARLHQVETTDIDW